MMKYSYPIILLIVLTLLSCKKDDHDENNRLTYKGEENQSEHGFVGVSFTYDDRNRLIKQKENRGCYYITIEYAYNDLGKVNLITETHGNCNAGDLSITESYFEYDSLGILVQKIDKQRDIQGSTFWDYDQTLNYTYDVNNNLIRVESDKDYLDMTNSFSQSFIDSLYYNINNQLSKIDKYYSTSAIEYVRSTAYTYDGNGNATEKKEYYNGQLNWEEEYQYDDRINPLYNVSALNRADNYFEHQAGNNVTSFQEGDSQTKLKISYIYTYNSNDCPKSVRIYTYYVDHNNSSNNYDRSATHVYMYESF